MVESIAGPSLESVCMTHPILSSLTQQPLKSNPTVTSGLPNIIQRSAWCDENNTSCLCSLSADLIHEEAPISVHSVCLASGSSLSTWHYLNLSVSSPCLHPSVPQTHRLGSDFQITLGESSGCRAGGTIRSLYSKTRWYQFWKNFNVYYLFLCCYYQAIFILYLILKRTSKYTIHYSELGLILLKSQSGFFSQCDLNNKRNRLCSMWIQTSCAWSRAPPSVTVTSEYKHATCRRNKGWGMRLFDMKTLNDWCFLQMVFSVLQQPLRCDILKQYSVTNSHAGAHLHH